MKNKLSGGIMKWFIALRPKMYSYLSYLTDDDSVDKKKKTTKKCVIKCKFKITDSKKCLEKNEKILKLWQKYRSDVQHLFTENVNKIALSTRDDMRLKRHDRTISYVCGASVGRV